MVYTCKCATAKPTESQAPTGLRRHGYFMPPSANPPAVCGAMLALQAALEIRQLKDTVGAGNNRVKELVQQVRNVIVNSSANLIPCDCVTPAGWKSCHEVFSERWMSLQHMHVFVIVLQVNKLSAALEDLSDEAVLLRRKAGLPADESLDTAGIKLQKDITIAQLRSVNALLERQVCTGPCSRLRRIALSHQVSFNERYSLMKWLLYTC